VELTINQALRRAIASQKNGDLLEAENLYRSILRVEPAHPDANHNLGLIEASGNKIEEALRLFKTALDANPKVEQFWFSYIDALIKENLLDEAKKVVSNAKEAELSDSALNLFIQQIDDQILHPTPRQSELDILLNDYKNGSHGVVEKRALSITKDFPNHPFAWKVLSALFLDLGRDKDSLSANLKVLELAPKDAEAHNNLGSILNRMGRLEEAEASCKRAIELRPDFAEAHSNLGNTLNALGRFAEAEASCRQAINLKLGFSVAYRNLTIALRGLGRYEEAEESERKEKILTPTVTSKSDKSISSGYPGFNKPRPTEYPIFYREGMGTESVGNFLRAMILMLRPEKILEIGAGYTTPFLLEGMVNNYRVYDDGNLSEYYFKNYKYEPKLVIIDDMSLGELTKQPGMIEIINSDYTDFIEGNFQGQAPELERIYKGFDFVWFDCGGETEYRNFIDEYWDLCTSHIFFHYTYSNGSPNNLHDLIMNSAKGKLSFFDIVEPHKSKQGSITIVKKVSES
tara:strand:+ start:639 stop:2186 length:1548 start_codon:yes stop_codon:yes gene_type:complete